MAKQSVSIDEKIRRQKEEVSTAKDKYEVALNELNHLIKKKQDIQGKELLNAFVNSDKSLDALYLNISCICLENMLLNSYVITNHPSWLQTWRYPDSIYEVLLCLRQYSI